MTTRKAKKAKAVPRKTKQTLWQLLRNHGVGLYAAQCICNDAILNGVSIPRDKKVKR